ncbi:MAG TPA: pantetheine-phosphate adenylyltransferase [Bacteroidales bacterium]|nr:pantetheine-phosphate adenylyltransferase [Bacteroidales bacterium]HRX95432.1 pantetheine-phosphate adenylyltransferase [Bacteroidales bacterium]
MHQKIAVFPGSFDPITRGHESIIRRAIPLFDKLYVAIGVNAEKRGFFDVEQRMNWIRQVFDNESSIVVTSYEGLTVDFCKQNNVRYILRGLRTSADFEFERSIGQVNKKLYPEIETVFLLTAPGYTFLNSSIVRDILRHGGDASMFVPEQIDLKNISIK